MPLTVGLRERSFDNEGWGWPGSLGRVRLFIFKHLRVRNFFSIYHTNESGQTGGRLLIFFEL